ncbi:hypothetical protein NQZ68_035197 [Dissostichus eleginoides]|nr:hypothetical protein NQZ68_035197 [Dissostichus eleginoides]
MDCRRRSASPVRADWLRRINGGWFVLGCIRAGAAAAANTSKALLLLALQLHRRQVQLDAGGAIPSSFLRTTRIGVLSITTRI